MRSKPKPHYLGRHEASVFEEQSVVDAYKHRSPYPAEFGKVLEPLIPKTNRRILEVGSGTGDLTLILAGIAEKIDAIEVSAAAVEVAKARLGHRNISWMCSLAEEADYHGPYGMIVAGDSVHWMEWATVFPKFAAALAPGGHFVIVDKGGAFPECARREMLDIFSRYTTNPDWKPYDLIEELFSRRYFQPAGNEVVSYRRKQPLADFIESLHARSGFSRQRMSKHNAVAFDAEISELMDRYFPDRIVELEIPMTVTWGIPTLG